MTATEVWDALAASSRPEPKRDRWGRYVLPHPDTGEEQPWTRATTWASSIADTFGLTKWEVRMTALGLAQRKDLFAQVASVTDPDDPDAKRLLNRLCEQAKEHAGSSAGANLGTALHSFAENADLGREQTVPEPWDRDIEAYLEVTRGAGIEMPATWVERICVVPELDVAGTLDRLAHVPFAPFGDGLVVADLKTGKDLSYAWGEIAVQLALYAHATTIWDQAAGRHAPMPKVDQRHGLVIHLPVGRGTCDLYVVDLEAGWEAAQVCGTVRRWRARKDLAAPVKVAAPSTTPADDPFQGLPDGSPPPTVERTAPAGDPPAFVGRVMWAKNRVKAIVDAGHGDELAALWPDGVPTFATGEPAKTNTHIDAIAAACATVERNHTMPFPRPDPIAEPLKATSPAATSPTPPALVAAGDPRVAALTERFARLPVDLTQAIEANARDFPPLGSGRASEDHFADVEDWVGQAEATWEHRKGVLASLVQNMADAEADAYLAATGATKGPDGRYRITETQAEVLCDLIDAREAGHVHVTDGAVVASPAGIEAVKVVGKTRARQIASAAATTRGEAPPRNFAELTADVRHLAHVSAELQKVPA